MNFGTGMDRTYNFVSIGFLIAGLLICIGTFIFVLIGGGSRTSVVQEIPATITVPTETPFDTPAPAETLTPTVSPT